MPSIASLANMFGLIIKTLTEANFARRRQSNNGDFTPLFRRQAMIHSGPKLYPFTYPSPRNLVGQPLVRGGECVGLVQEFVVHLGHTSTWKQGERVVGTHHLQPGTVIANFENGKWPRKPHGNHACFFLEYGPRSMTTGIATSILVVEQFIAADVKAIQARWLRSQGHWKSGEWIDPSNNSDAFFVVLG